MGIYVLGPFRLDTESALLLHGGEPTALGRRAAVLLRLLVEQRGALVSREALIEAAWPGQIVEDGNLTVQIGALRKVLDTAPGGDRWIETMPRRGYRFVGPVAAEKALETIATAAPADTARAPMITPQYSTVTAAANTGLALPDKPSVAVLPFLNISGDPEQEYFADGMAEDIITELSRFRALFVIARSSTFTYKGRAVDVREIARELGVRYVLEGSVRRIGDNVRVTAQLIDAISGVHLWAERYDRAFRDIFAMQDEITASVAVVIEPVLARAERERVLRKPPERLDAWEAYQRGLWHFYRYGAEDNRIAQTFFCQAIALDPNFAPGHYGIAMARFWDFWLYSTRPLAEVQVEALKAAHASVAADERDAMAHAVLALMTLTGGEWDAAIAVARAGLSLNPNNAFVLSVMGVTLTHGGIVGEGVEILRQAVRASPRDPMIWLWHLWIGWGLFHLGRFADAIEANHEVARLRPGFANPIILNVAALAHLGRLEEARATWRSLNEQYPERLALFRSRLPWTRPEDHERIVAGLGLAAIGA